MMVVEVSSSWRAEAPQKENVEAAEEASRQVPEQGPAPEMTFFPVSMARRKKCWMSS